MLFHSPMSRMNSTLPDAVDGESVPNTASWRRYQGTTATANSATAPSAAASGIRRGAPGLAAGSAHRPPAVPQERGAQHGEDQHAVVARERRQAGEQPRQGEGPGVAPQAPRGEEQRPGDQRLVQGEVVRLGHVDEGQGRERDQHARAHAHVRGRARVPPDRPRQRRGERPRDHERQRRGHRRGAQQPDERHLHQRRQRHPVRVGRDREHGVRRDGPADLREDPDEVHVEAVAGGQLPRDVHVVEGIGVGRVREPGGDHQPRHEGKQEQDDGRAHCRCRLAPGPVAAGGYEGARAAARRTAPTPGHVTGMVRS